MMRTRKGFTLVELLIVVAILGALTAIMTASTGDTTARAKATTIASNIEACKLAAAVFFSEHFDDAKVPVQVGEAESATDTQMSAVTVTAFLENKASGYNYLPSWSNFSSGSITFTAGSGAGHDNWNIVVSFADDAEATKIQSALSKMKGYSAVVSGKTGFTINLITGEISNLTPTEASGG